MTCGHIFVVRSLHDMNGKRKHVGLTWGANHPMRSDSQGRLVVHRSARIEPRPPYGPLKCLLIRCASHGENCEFNWIAQSTTQTQNHFASSGAEEPASGRTPLRIDPVGQLFAGTRLSSVLDEIDMSAPFFADADQSEEDWLYENEEEFEDEDSPLLEFIRVGEPESESCTSYTRRRVFAKKCDCGRPLGDAACCVFADEDYMFTAQGGDDALFSRMNREAAYYMYSAIDLLSRLNLNNSHDAQLAREKLSLWHKISHNASFRWFVLHRHHKLWMKRIGRTRSGTREYEQNMRYVLSFMRSTKLPQPVEGQGLIMSKTVYRLLMPNEPLDALPGQSVQDYVKQTCGYFWDKIRNLFSFLSESILTMIDTAYQKFLEYMCRCVFGDNIPNLLDLTQEVHRRAVLACSVFSVWVIVKLMGIVTDQVANALYSFAMSGLTSMSRFVCQTELDPVALMATLCVGVIGVTIQDFGGIRTMVYNISCAVAGGTVASNAFKVLLLILPPALKMALTYRFGSKTQRFEHDAERWRTMSQSLCAVSKIQTVLASKEYAKRIQEQVKSGSELLRTCPSDVKPLVKTSITSTYVRLLAIHCNLVTKKYNAGDRSVPFAFHVAGPPGIGKTSSIRALLAAACGFTHEDVYNKDGSDEYWSGYLNQPAIVMDEFLLGEPSDNYLVAQSYLTMVSSGEWRPNFASVDDPNVGIKGSTGRPRVVVTLNNVMYDRIDEKINDAFWRRRAFVINARRSDRYIENPRNKSNVWLEKYSDEDRMNRIWMKFDICPAIPIEGRSPQPILFGLTYQEMVAFVRQQFQEHEQLFATAMRDMNQGVVEDKTADEILNEVMRDTWDIPSEPLSVVEALKASFLPVFAQGPTEESDDNGILADTVIDEVRNTGQAATIILRPEPNTGLLSRLISNPIARTVALTAGLVVIVAAVGRMVTGGTIVPETFWGQSAKVNKTTKGKSRERGAKLLREARAQGPSVSTVKLSLGDGPQVTAIPIGGRLFLTYLHSLALEHAEEGTLWTVETPTNTYTHPLSLDTVVVDAENDLCIVCVDCPQMPQYKDITKFFVNEHDIAKINNTCVSLNTGERTMFSNALVKSNFRYVVANGAKEIVLSQAAEYRCPTEYGDCGTPVKILSGGLANRVLGIHVAGTGTNLVESPFGVATFVTQEFIRESKGLISVAVGQGPNPNLEWQEKLSWNEVVNVPKNTKLRKSTIASKLGWITHKEPAIMSRADERSGGLDPIEVSLDELYNTECPDPDPDLLKRIEDELVDKYVAGLSWPAGKRQLTFEEACGGIPGVLNSLNISTSPGYPLVHVAKKKGKTDFVWFEGQKLCYTPEFKQLVEERVKEMEGYDGGEINNRFLGFLKDELLPERKIKAVRTRMTFANDLISLVAFRMVFGAALVAFQSSFECTGFAIGLNQYSKDMGGVYNRLNAVGSRFAAIDYKSFDKNYVSRIQKSSYRVFCRVARAMIPSISQNSCDYLIRHETSAPFQIGDRLVKVKCSNLSGCFLTTVVNCIQNNFYVRFCFYRKYPHHQADNELGTCVLGDDLVYSVSDRVEMTPLELAERMKEIGQQVTSAFKDRELEDCYEPFENLTFLGAIPRKSLTGEWTGALRKETLYETPQWTRDQDLSCDQVTQQMIDCASQWDREFFEKYVGDLKKAYKECHREWVLNDNYSSLHHAVMNRTAASGADFLTFFAQGPCTSSCDVDEESRNVRHVKVTVEVAPKEEQPVCYAQGSRAPLYEPGLTQVATAEETDVSEESGNLVSHLGSLALSAEEGDYGLGAHSFVKRGVYSWSSSTGSGFAIAEFTVPFDILTANQTSNVQDVGFFQYLYSQPELELKFLVNGTPVQQGALVAFFMPFQNASSGSSITISDYTMLDHVFLTPNNNSASTLTIPFRAWKTFLNNKIGFTTSDNQFMGRVRLMVLSPLTTVSLPTTASVSVYSRIRSKFYVPRPRTANGQGPIVRGQGVTYSTNSVSNDYHVGSVAGSMPAQTTLSNKTKQRAKLPAITMDNPPIVGCSVPIHQVQPSMAKAVGVEPTVALQMHPAMMHRQPDSFRFTDETRIEDVLARRGYLPNGLFTISTTDAVGQEYVNIPLNSVLGNVTPANNNQVPANVAVLNQFQRWRADIEIELFCAKTVFHSTRLLLVSGYGASGSLASVDYDSYPNRIVEFTGENQWASTTINFNAPTEFLRTYDGLNTQSVDDYSMGVFSIICLNPLKVASSVVSTSCNVLMFVRFRNVRVYEPRTSTWVTLASNAELYQLVGQGPMDATSAITSPMEGNGDIIRKPGDATDPQTVGVTDSEKNTSEKERPCDLQIGSKFEYTVRDVCELGRRHYQVFPNKIDGWSATIDVEWNGNGPDMSTASAWTNSRYYSFNVYPLHPICRLYGAWSGHLKYRFVFPLKKEQASAASMSSARVAYIASTLGSVTQTSPAVTGTGTYPPVAGTANTVMFDALSLMPPESLIGKTGAGGSATWNANTYIQKPWLCTNATPLETCVQFSSGYCYIDVSVPFSTNLNVLPTFPTSFRGNGMDPYNGRIVIQVPTSNQTQAIEVYQAFGDDFRLHGFSPNTPHVSDGYFLPSIGTGVITAPTAGQQLGQNVYGPHN